MTHTEWLAYYTEHRHKFKWFIDKHFMKGLWTTLEGLHCLGKDQPEYISRLYTYLNDIWYGLPDNQFNIIENPAGWNEFLHLLENPPEL